MANGLSSHLDSQINRTKLISPVRLDHEERTRKRIARESHKQSQSAQKLHGLRAKLYQRKRHAEKIQMKKQIRAHEARNVKSAGPSEPSSTPLPQYLLDRSQPSNAKALSSAIKNKRNEKAARFSVPLPKVRGIAEEEMFKVVKTGKKTAKKGWKRMITKPTFGECSHCSSCRRKCLGSLPTPRPPLQPSKISHPPLPLPSKQATTH